MELQWERNFREQMRRRRDSIGDSQTALARKIAARGLAFHQPTIQRIEDGVRPVRLDEAHVIAQVLGTTVSAMVASSSDLRIDGAIAVDRLTAQAVDLSGAIGSTVLRWEEEIEPLLNALDAAMKSSSESPSDLSCWLGAWVAKALLLERSAAQVADMADAYDDEAYIEDEGGRTAALERSFFSTEAQILLRDEAWTRVPSAKHPSTLAALHPSMLRQVLDESGRLNLGPDGPIGPQPVKTDSQDDDIEAITNITAELTDDGVDQAAP